MKVTRLERTEEQLADYKNPDEDPRGPWRAQDLSASKPYKAGEYTITTPAGIEVNPPPGRYWRCNREQYDAWIADNRIWFGKGGTGRPMLKAFLSEVQGGLTPHTWWSHEFAGHNKEATLEVKELFDGAAPFDTAKPVKLLRRILELFTAEAAIVMDFFAGSATLAQSMLELNREGGRRSFILVQYPEPTGSPPYATIADVAKERIRRVVKKLRLDDEGQIAFPDSTPEDLGFKVFKLVAPHIRPWAAASDRDPDAYAAKLTMFNDPLVPGWRPADVLWELALREGLSLSARFAERKLPNGNTVYELTDPEGPEGTAPIAVCLDGKVTADLSKHYELTPDRVLIVRDIALDDTAAANLSLQCRLKVV